MAEAQNIACPFCENRYVMAKPGKVHCPMCDSEFEIDDRLECIFVDPDYLRLPAVGTICVHCGLIQAGENENCLYCGVKINTAVQ